MKISQCSDVVLKKLTNKKAADLCKEDDITQVGPRTYEIQLY